MVLVLYLISALCANVPHRLPYFFLTFRRLAQFATATRLESPTPILDLFLPIMSDEQTTSAVEATQRQVRVQLMSKQEDIALPENTGPILVPTGMYTLHHSCLKIL